MNTLVVLGITGPSGAGKTTLARNLALFYRARKYNVEILSSDGFFKDGYDIKTENYIGPNRESPHSIDDAKFQKAFKETKKRLLSKEGKDSMLIMEGHVLLWLKSMTAGTFLYEVDFAMFVSLPKEEILKRRQKTTGLNEVYFKEVMLPEYEKIHAKLPYKVSIFDGMESEKDLLINAIALISGATPKQLDRHQHIKRVMIC